MCVVCATSQTSDMKLFFWFKATTVVDQELLESNIPVEQVGSEGDQAAASILGKPWTTTTTNLIPPRTPPFQEEGGPHAPGVAQDIATAAEAAVAAFEVRTQRSTVRTQKTRGQYMFFSFSFQILFFSFF